MPQAARRVLSTDPNAGTPVRAARVLSTDPSAGQPAPTAQPVPTRAEHVRTAVADYHQSIANDPLKQIGIGADKGFENTIIGFGRLMAPLVGADKRDFDVARESNQPTNTAQRIGYGAEQVGEFIALPASKGNLLRRATQEAIEGGALSAAQGGDPVMGAITGGVGPAVSHVVSAGAQHVVPALRTNADRLVMQALGPTKERFKAMAARITPEILRRGLSGSREAILARATQVADDVGTQIDGALQQYAQRQIGTTPIVDALETAKDAFRTTQQLPIADAMKRGLTGRARDLGNGMVAIDVVFEPRAINQLTGLQGIIRELGDNATVEQLVAIRRAWDKVVDQAGGFAHRAPGAVGQPLSDQAEAWAKREATGAIRKALASELPDLATLNREFAFWKSLEDVLTQTTQRTQPHGPGLGATITKRAGQVIGAGGGSPGGVTGMVTGAVIGGAVATRLHQLLTSPRFRLLDARFKNGLADALVSGNEQAIVGQVMRANAALLSGGALRPMPAH